MSYWQDRFLNKDKEVFKDAEEYVQYLHEQYQSAISEIEKNISYHLLQIQKEQGLDITEARKLLTSAERMDLDKFIKLSKGKVTDRIEKQLQLESRRVRISHLQAMELELKTAVAKMMSNEEKGLFAHLSNTYEKKYYENLYELQRITGYKNVNGISSQSIAATVKGPWAPDGKDFSERIWSRGDKLVNILRQDLSRDIMTGKNSKETIKHIVDTMNVSRANAARLVMTETAAINSKATLDSYKEFGSEKYEICATLDLKTSEICQEMDGKKFNLEEYEIDVTAPPFHPNCRTTTLPCFDDEIERELDEAVGRLARHLETGKNEHIPNMNYKEWYGRYITPYVDKEEYNEIVKVLGKIAPTIETFKDWKYNDSEKYERLLREKTTISKIDSKSWNESYKARVKDTYYEFRELGHEFNMHGVERFLKNLYMGKYTKEEVLNILSKEFNFKQIKDDRLVKYYNNIQIIYSDNEIEVLNVIKRRVAWKWEGILHGSSK